MPSPRELERAFAAALLSDADEAVVAEILGDGLAPAARLAIYRSHIFITLTEALQATFPVVVRLVDGRFFAYAADRYIRAHPPSGPCLFEYGASLPHFLAAFPACRHLEYLADVARLEWAINRARHAEDAVALDPRWLATVPPGEVGRLTFRLHPSVALLESRWPVDRIWRANQPGAEPDATVSLDDGGVRLLVRRLDDDVVFRPLASGAYAFRQALGHGRDLEHAARAAHSTDLDFDLTCALRELLDEELLVGASAHPHKDGACRCELMPCPR
ncbi:MAG: DNA-binding domain-containing protein [Candidatus Rokuibacteriota bacterium]